MPPKTVAKRRRPVKPKPKPTPAPRPRRAGRASPLRRGGATAGNVAVTFVPSYESTLAYLNGVYEKYFRDTALGTLTNPAKTLNGNIKTLRKFAAIVDEKYGISDSKEWGNDLVDDTFEIFLLSKFADENGKIDIDKIDDGQALKYKTLVHDAWTLARMRQYNLNGDIENFSECNNGNDIIALDRQNFSTWWANATNPATNRLCVRIVSDTYGFETVVQARRLLQFQEFEFLSESEKALDETPMNAFKTLELAETKSIVDAIEGRAPASSGNAPSSGNAATVSNEVIAENPSSAYSDAMVLAAKNRMSASRAATLASRPAWHGGAVGGGRAKGLPRLHTGPRGGKYRISAAGVKTYVK
jgi:hypothetical protein